MTYEDDSNQSKSKKDEKLETDEKEVENYQSIVMGIRENKTSIKNITEQLDYLAQYFQQSNSSIKEYDKLLNEEVSLIKKNLNLIEERNITIYRDIKEIIDLNSKRIIYILHRQDKIYNIAPIRFLRKIKHYISKIKKYISEEKITKLDLREENQYDKIVANNFTLNDSPKKILNEIILNKSIDEKSL